MNGRATHQGISRVILADLAKIHWRDSVSRRRNLIIKDPWGIWVHGKKTPTKGSGRRIAQHYFTTDQVPRQLYLLLDTWINSSILRNQHQAQALRHRRYSSAFAFFPIISGINKRRWYPIFCFSRHPYNDSEYQNLLILPIEEYSDCVHQVKMFALSRALLIT